MQDKIEVSPDAPAEPPCPRRAIALNWDRQRAPVVSATGENELADEIVRIATEAGVPLYENAALLQSLAHLELGDEIPELLYRCIAEVIAYAYLIRDPH